MSKIEQLKLWISYLIPGEAFDEYVQVVEDTGEWVKDTQGGASQTYDVRIFTGSRQSYRITGVDERKGDGYLGCINRNTHMKAGEEHTRGSDLPDGPFNKDTWDRIVNGIVRNELVALGD
jgi:hypothetical protein